MFALGINYLNGWAMAAADGAQKEVAEWPPHPDRVFMALAAAWFETGEDPSEGEALRWLETLGPPEFATSDHTTRTPIVSYVPVNDDGAPIYKEPGSNTWKHRQEGSLPIGRNRQPRGFPVAIPYDPTVHMVWQSTQLDEHRQSLESLADKVTHIGHSASLVQMWVADDKEIPEPTLIPTEGVAAHRMRMFSRGRLDVLARMYNKSEVLEYAELKTQLDSMPQISKIKGKGSTQRRREIRELKRQIENRIEERFGSRIPVSLPPTPTRWQGYSKPMFQQVSDEPHSVFDPNLIVLAIKGRRVPVTTTLRLMQALRGALMDSCPEQPPPEWFSGHTPDGFPTTSPHMAMFPLPFASGEHADGRVMGLALALPRGLNRQDAAHCVSGFLYDSNTGMPRRHTLFDGRWFECVIELETRERPPFNLRPDTWTRESRVWASVTPVVFNRHFDGDDMWERAAESMKDACEHIGLPRPTELLLHPTSLVQGIPLSREFARMTRNRGGGQRRHAHAVIIFDKPVRGPVMIGAGRFRGYGLCRPVDNGR